MCFTEGLFEHACECMALVSGSPEYIDGDVAGGADDDGEL